MSKPHSPPNDLLAALMERVPPEIRHLIPGYLANRAADLQSIKNLLEAGRYREIVRIGHTMKGSGSAYGLDMFTQIGKVLEESALNEEHGPLQTQMLRLDAYLKELGAI